MKIPDFARRRVLRLPVYFWASLLVSSLAGVAIGAVLFSASFNAHVNIVAVGANLVVLDSDGVTVLASNLQSNVNTLEFGTVSVDSQVTHGINIKHGGLAGSRAFYFRVPGSLTVNNGQPLPSGVTLDLTLTTSCQNFGGTVNPDGSCSIPFGAGRVHSFTLVLGISSTASPQDLTVPLTITVYDTPT